MREFREITEALAKFHHCLLGHNFIIQMNQKSLRELIEQTLHTPEQQPWLHKFLGFDFTIEYKPEKDNLTADALSRVCLVAWYESHIHTQTQFLTDLHSALQQDSHLSLVIQQCLDHSILDPNVDTLSLYIFVRKNKLK